MLSPAELNQEMANKEKILKFESLNEFGNDGMGGTSGLDQIEMSSKMVHTIWISFYEVYNDSVYDLLNLKSYKIKDSRPSLKIREDLNKIPYVQG